MSGHHWDRIRSRPTMLDGEFARQAVGSMATKGFHESLFRSYAILEEAERLLARGDSAETVATFIDWAKRGDA